MILFSSFPCYISVKVIPNAAKTEIQEIMSDGTIKIKVAAIPEKGKANEALIKFFKNNYKVQALIVGGEGERKKLIRIENNE